MAKSIHSYDVLTNKEWIDYIYIIDSLFETQGNS